MVDTLFVYYRHKPGGLCKRLYRAINACAERGDRVTFLTLDPPPTTFHPNVSICYIPFFSAKREGLCFWGVFTLYLPFVLLCFSYVRRPKRIIAFGPYYAAMSLPSQFLLGRRIFLFLRSLTFKIDSIKGKPRWLRCITGAVDYVGIKAASAVIAMTKVMRSDAEEFSGRDLSLFPVLPNNIHFHQKYERVSTEGETHFLFAGVLDQRKNIELLIRAWKLLQEGDSQRYILHIVGDGSDRAKLEALCNTTEVKGVQFHGWQPQLDTYLKMSSLYLHPSVHEGVSNSLVEALGANIPVLASDIPEHKEIFESCPATSNLLPPDNPGVWANSVRRYCSDKDFQQKIHELCSRASKKLDFNWEERFFDITRF